MTADETIYVWRSMRERGWYALCSDRDHPKLRPPNWDFVGELPAVADLADLSRDTIRTTTRGGRPCQVFTVTRGSYVWDNREL